MDAATVWIGPVLAIVLAPLLAGIVNRTKAFVAGRRGAPLLQLYFDLWRLARKGAVYSKTTSWVFRAGPVVGLSAVLAVALLVPLGGLRAPLAFEADLVLAVYLLALQRFFLVAAALDTGSSFEGMGASREVQFAALAEPAFILALTALAKVSGSLSLSGILAAIDPGVWSRSAPTLVLVIAALLVVFLAENSRLPFDDPATHLELTMIHEVMVLDHGGPDLAYVLYASSLKLWLLGSVLVGLAVPVRTGSPWIDLPAAVAGMIALAVVVGGIESTMARLRLSRVPNLLVTAGALAVIALFLVSR